MKSTRFLLFFSLALSFRPALAQVAAKPANATPIRYSRAIPNSVLKLMPRGAKSLFWGTFSPKKGSALAIHVFSSGPSGIFERLTTDVFVRDKKRLEHMNRVPMKFAGSLVPNKYQTNSPKPFLMNANFFWIAPNQRVPLFVLRYFKKDTESSGSKFGDAVFVSFKEDWKSKATVQSFFFGPSNLDLTFYHFKRTPMGMLQIFRDDGSMNIGRDAQGNDIRALSVFRWNGRKFVVTSQTKEMLGPNDTDWKP